jgi:hypothetical protein
MSFKHTSVALLALAFGFSSCDKDKDSEPTLRPKMDTSSLTGSSSYTESFKDASGQSTVSLSTSNTRLDMFTELNTYMARVASATPTALDGTQLRNLYINNAAPFQNAALNTSGLQLRNATAASLPAQTAEAVRTYIDQNLTTLARISQNTSNTQATQGQVGRLGAYLVDEKGIEVNQVIQKALIGALLLDQIDNVLLSEQALNADNSKTVSGQNYSELEHNWDLAYGYLTNKPVMVTVFDANNRERFLAGYLNEKNGAGSPRVYLAFLQGRAAIVNNDKNQVKAQADIIRTELEKTIALSAVSYLDAWKSKPDQAGKVHALAEGIGFIYSLRFCTKHGVTTAWADQVLNRITSSPQGHWSLTAADANAAAAEIKTKFNIQ